MSVTGHAHMGVGIWRGQKKMLDLLELESGCEPPNAGAWKPKQGPLQEQ